MSDILSRLVSNNNTSASTPPNEANQNAHNNNNNKENNINSNNVAVSPSTLLAQNHDGNRAKNNDNNNNASSSAAKVKDEEKKMNKNNNNNNDDIRATLQKLIKLLVQQKGSEVIKLLRHAVDTKKLLEARVDAGDFKGTLLLSSGLHSSPRIFEMLLRFIEQVDDKDFSKQQLQSLSNNNETLFHRIVADPDNNGQSATEKFKIAMTFANKILDEDELKNILRIKADKHNVFGIAFSVRSRHYDLLHLVIKTYQKLGSKFFQEIISSNQSHFLAGEVVVTCFDAITIRLYFTTIEEYGGIEMLKKHLTPAGKDFPGMLIAAATMNKKHQALEVVLDVFEKVGDNNNLRQTLLSSNPEDMTLCMTVCGRVSSTERLKIFFNSVLRRTDESFLKTMLSSEGAKRGVGLCAILSNENVTEDMVYYFCSLLWKHDLFLKHFMTVSSDKNLKKKLQDFNIDASYQGEPFKTTKQDWMKKYNQEHEKCEVMKKQLDEEHQKLEVTKKELEKEKNNSIRLHNQNNNLEQKVSKQETEVKSAKDKLNSVEKRAQEVKKSFDDKLAAEINKINQKEANLRKRNEEYASLQKQLDIARKAGNNNNNKSNNNDDDDNNQDEMVVQLKQKVDEGNIERKKLEDKLKKAEAIIDQLKTESADDLASLRHQLEAATKAGKNTKSNNNNNNNNPTAAAKMKAIVEKERDDLQAVAKERQQKIDVLNEMLDESNKACKDLRVEVGLLKKKLEGGK